jgi:hypothetical protein
MYKNALPMHTGPLFLICLLFLCIHGCFFLFDLADPTAFLRGDRAMDRFTKIKEMQEATSLSFPNLILNSGVPGDFLQHTLLYWLGGRYLLITCQIALQLVTMVITYLSAVRLTGSAAVATAAGLFLVVMPGTLMDPHLLTTETWFTAFVTLGTLLVCQSVDPSGRVISACTCYVGFVSLALASSIRPQALLVPFAIVVCLYARLGRDSGKIFIGGLLSYATFPISWMTLRFLLMGDFGLGASNADLAFNLGLRADRILAIPLETTGRLSLSTFFEIAMFHPLATLNTFYSDALNLIFNPGINHVFGYYLGLFESPHGYLWNQIRDQSGIFGVMMEILNRNAVFVMLFIIWVVIHLTILFATATVALRAVRGGSQAQSWIWVTLVVAVTVIASGFAAGQVRWNHRAGVEPLLALLAACGLFHWKSVVVASVDFGKKLGAH